jgi:hypothetical protein
LKNGNQRFALFVLSVLGALITGCGDGDELTVPSAPPIPSWIVSVEPRPDAESATFRRVEVKHEVLTDGENVRLFIDGTDVTAYAEFGREDTVGGPGLLVYDFEQARDFVPLEPGPHTAKVERVRLPGPGEQLTVLDSYSWSFTIQ